MDEISTAPATHTAVTKTLFKKKGAKIAYAKIHIQFLKRQKTKKNTRKAGS